MLSRRVLQIMETIKEYILKMTTPSSHRTIRMLPMVKQPVPSAVHMI
jgi:hypothetical protein